MEPINLPSNGFWGRRSGKSNHRGKAAGAFVTGAFVQMQYGAGKTGAGKAFKSPLKNVNRKWFGKTYNHT